MASSQPGNVKRDAHQALVLLEEYSTTLGDGNRALQSAINRLIRVFRSRLFSALLEIQEFYEGVLLDSDANSQEKTSRALDMAAKWEAHSFIPGRDRDVGKSPRVPTLSKENSTTPPVPKKPVVQRDGASPTLPPPPPKSVDPRPPSTGAKPSLLSQHEEHTFTLTKDSKGDTYGFAIAGGTDKPIKSNDSYLYVNTVQHSGRAAAYLRPNDLLVAINGFDVGNGYTSQMQALDIIKEAGLRLVLGVRRASQRHFYAGHDEALAPETPRRLVSLLTDQKVVVLTKSKPGQSLGFSIKGGRDNVFLEGSNGIYVYRLYDDGLAMQSRGVDIGDQLLEVNSVNLENVAHEKAVSALKGVADDAVLLLQPSEISGKDLPKRPRKREADERKIVLCKPEGVKSLGVNIVGGESGQGIFISFIMSGGVADQNNELKRGDKILEVDGHDFGQITHHDAATFLKNSGQKVEMVVAFRPQEYGAYEHHVNQQRAIANPNSGTLRTTEKKSMHVRTLFFYDKGRDAGLPSEGLSFRFGDILHVTNAADKEWWQAKHVNMETNADEGGAGVIPSKERYEKRERARNRRVNFGPSSVDLSDIAEDRRQSQSDAPGSGALPKRRRSFTFSKRLPFMKKQEKESKTKGSEDRVEEEEKIPSYDVVQLQTVSYRRPIIILGPFKDRINDELCTQNPDLFGTCVPHTSRDPRPDEAPGVDYHFASAFEMNEGIKQHNFIEAGIYKEKYYGTSVEAVRLVAEDHNKHCVLDVSGYAIKRLLMAGLHPIAILVKPASLEQLRNLNRRVTDEHARIALEKAQRTEEEFKDVLTAIIEGEYTHDEIFRMVSRVISVHGNQRSWLTANPPPPPSS